MRLTRTTQLSLFDDYSEHKYGKELRMISDLLDQSEALVELVKQDLHDAQVKSTGRIGLSVESILRCIILKQRLQVSYEQLAFQLSDSPTYRAFVRLQGNVIPKKSCLQASMRRVTPATLELLNQTILLSALQEKTMNLDTVRADSTVVLCNIAPPSDSSLLNDSIRVLSRLLQQSKEITGKKIRFQDQRKAAKSLAFRIFNAKKPEKERLYPDLLQTMAVVLNQVERGTEQLTPYAALDSVQRWLTRVEHYKNLALKVVEQTRKRVIEGKKVPSSEKLVSIFEEHTDIIVKGQRDIQYGHKINLSTQAAGLITCLTVESGNPCDSQLHTPVIEYHQKHYGSTPKAIVADGCYTSTANLKSAKEKGVKNVVFTKPGRFGFHDMGVKQKTFKKLKKFRAGVEANISEFKRSFGGGKAKWKGHEGFQAYVWSSVLSYNLLKLVRLSL